jgi:LDH2 family malate/lactate/ureidoglycolate dehydrogenase
MLDMATSVSSFGKIKTHALEGRPPVTLKAGQDD